MNAADRVWRTPHLVSDILSCLWHGNTVSYITITRTTFELGVGHLYREISFSCYRKIREAAEAVSQHLALVIRCIERVMRAAESAKTDSIHTFAPYED